MKTRFSPQMADRAMGELTVFKAMDYAKLTCMLSLYFHFQSEMPTLCFIHAQFGAFEIFYAASKVLPRLVENGLL